MAKNKRNYDDKFLKYQEFIVTHKNYEGLPIEKSKDGTYRWVTTKKTDIGKKRIAWCEERARELGLPIREGVYAKVMRAVHPTKVKVCQTCGREMSIMYLYPTKNFIKAIDKEFGYTIEPLDDIGSSWDKLINAGMEEGKIKAFFLKKLDEFMPLDSSKDNIIKQMEYESRELGKKNLSPGAMSNFPDRYDGFHTYNLCCRGSQDKGRSAENLKSYTKDRRAYEYWSDGNIAAANQFMGSTFFKGISADHVGPISLGFVHDPRYLRPITGSENSTKRDRLSFNDVLEIIKIQENTHVMPMSWFSKNIWEYIVESGSVSAERMEIYRVGLKQNMVNFMTILYKIKYSQCCDGVKFLTNAFLKEHYIDFAYKYSFNDLGVITTQVDKKANDANRKEWERYVRIAFDSIDEFFEKDNRNIKHSIENAILVKLDELINKIDEQEIGISKSILLDIMKKIEMKIIQEMDA
ncbi:MAG: Alw26I/Eco31I/Esp3I family type II restriction endonuclease [Bacillota bacterium]